MFILVSGFVFMTIILFDELHTLSTAESNPSFYMIYAELIIFIDWFLFQRYIFNRGKPKIKTTQKSRSTLYHLSD